MHILIMSVWYPTDKNPLYGIVVKRFAELLSREYEVTVIHTIADPKLLQLKVSDRSVNGVRTIIAKHPKGISSFDKWWFQRKARRSCFRKVEDIDLIFAHGFYPKGFQYLKAKRHFHCSLIIMEHSTSYGEKNSLPFLSWQKTQMRQISASVKKIIASSLPLKREMKSTFPTTNIEIIPNFVYNEAFPFRTALPKKYTRFIHISNLEEKHKNPLLLFESFEAALKINKDLHLTVVSNKNTAKWISWCETRNILNNVEFIGFASSLEISKLIHDNHCLICTSNYESFGLGIAEAWMTGTPVLSSSVGIAENCPSIVGLNAKTKNEFTSEILKFSDGAYTFNALEIHSYALQFSDETVLKQLKTLFEPYFEDRD
jgi:L-malate glycosyltransferase